MKTTNKRGESPVPNSFGIARRNKDSQKRLSSGILAAAQPFLSKPDGAAGCKESWAVGRVRWNSAAALRFKMFQTAVRERFHPAPSWTQGGIIWLRAHLCRHSSRVSNSSCHILILWQLANKQNKVSGHRSCSSSSSSTIYSQQAQHPLLTRDSLHSENVARKVMEFGPDVIVGFPLQCFFAK